MRNENGEFLPQIYKFFKNTIFCENFEDGKIFLQINNQLSWGLFKNKKNLKSLYLNVQLKI